MRTRLLMGPSAVFMGVVGLVLSFLPQEILAATDIPPVGVLVVLVLFTSPVERKQEGSRS